MPLILEEYRCISLNYLSQFQWYYFIVFCLGKIPRDEVKIEKREKKNAFFTLKSDEQFETV